MVKRLSPQRTGTCLRQDTFSSISSMRPGIQQVQLPRTSEGSVRALHRALSHSKPQAFLRLNKSWTRFYSMEDDAPSPLTLLIYFPYTSGSLCCLVFQLITKSKQIFKKLKEKAEGQRRDKKNHF